MKAQVGNRAALGFAPHSGWAVLVALGGGGGEPRVLVRARIEMADPRLTGSKQPYHEVEGLPLAEAQRRLSRYQESARTMAESALRAVVEDLRRDGHLPASAGILESSGRKDVSLASILASHALIHSADGDHFREALAQASGRCGLAVHRVPGRQLIGRASAALGKRAEAVQAALKTLGRPPGPPWGADQKSAALLAWLLLLGGLEEGKPRGSKRARARSR